MYTSLQNLISSVSQYKALGILGFGREGKAFLDFCTKYITNSLDASSKINIIIFDKFLTQEKLDVYLAEKNSLYKNINIKLYSGENYKSHFSDAEIIVKAPGVSCFHENISDDDITKYNITSLSDLFLQFFGNQTIGITGTKGKSTTSSLLHYLFEKAGKKSFLVGNIGTPVFEILEKITEESVIIHEFSSHQLEKITVGPKVAVLLNMFPEHLDYYKNKEEYFNAKKNIFRTSNVNSDDYISIENYNFVHNSDNSDYNTRKNKLYFNAPTLSKTSEKYLEKIQNISVHKDTVRVAKIVSNIYDLSKNEEEFIKNINTFSSLPHRLEIIKSINNLNNLKNILYINDSISTIPESTIEGIRSVKELEKSGKKLETIILGGFDRGICLDTLVNFVLHSSLKNIFLLAQTGKILEQKFIKNLKNIKDSVRVMYREKLEDIIPLVEKYSSENSICLFSPSASSFDQYKNFEERGEHFKSLVEKQENI